ncbi:unnamed protein product [Meganyctiphanes norvegica]|uniref:Ig-like domain-containing protein n=1 Tax=Meganyctiphanes norvegica TaxID=48144 RepID=A0AAV2RA11_MEGNR
MEVSMIPLMMRSNPSISCIKFVMVLLFLTLSCTNAAIAVAVSGLSGLESGAQKWWRGWEHQGEPLLASDQINVTAIPGHTVTLPCRVSNLRDKTVSWIRTRDLTVLAVDLITVSTDNRIRVVHHEGTEDWLLEIRKVVPEDGGRYECQVNTHPKISTKVNLHVLQNLDLPSIHDIPVADTGIPPKQSELLEQVSMKMQGRHYQEVSPGATIHLICKATGRGIGSIHVVRPPSHNLISWTVDDVPVKALWSKDKVEVQESWREDYVESIMTLHSVQPEDSGTFSCLGPRDELDKVIVSIPGLGGGRQHIQHGKMAAATGPSRSSSAASDRNHRQTTFTYLTQALLLYLHLMLYTLIS